MSFQPAPPTAAEKARWEHLALDGLRKGNHICGLHKLSPSERKVALQFHGLMIEQAQCPHLEYKGADILPINHPRKRWRCTACGFIRVGTDGGRDE